jgi:tRNA A37 threonylcarbamoyltransferase TsaD
MRTKHRSIPPLDLCTDNAAMIALGGILSLQQSQYNELDMDALPTAFTRNTSLTG